MRRARSEGGVPAVWTLIVLATLSYAEGARAAEEPQKSSDIAEVVVTATRMGETRLQDTPLSISVFDSDALGERGIERIRDLGLSIGLTMAESSSWPRLYTRGIGTSATFVGSDPSTTFHLDGVYMARPAMATADLLNVERVEVLRGPQGTLFGRNSAGGTVNIISRLPGDERELEVWGEFGEYNRTRLGGALNQPIVPGKLNASFALLKVDSDGYVTNLEPASPVSRFVDDNTTAARSLWLYEPSKRLQAVLGLDYTELDDSGPMWKPSYHDNFGNPVLQVPGMPYPQLIDDPYSVRISQTDPTPERKITNSGVSLRLTAQLNESLSLMSLSAYREGDLFTAADSDFTEAIGGITVFDEEQRQLSQEVQLNWSGEHVRSVGGVYFLRETADFISANEFPFSGLRFFGSEDLGSLTVVDTDTDAYAAFAQATFDLTPQWALTGGARYSHETKNHDSSNEQFLDGVLRPGAFYADRGASWDAFTPKLGVEYRPIEGLLTYASATRGFKSGGYNNFADQDEFDPEYIWAYELGAKATLADGRVALSAVAFEYDYSDLQVQTFGVSTTGQPIAVIDNAATADIRGVEVEVSARAGSALDLALGLAYLDAKYAEYETRRSGAGPLVDLSGNELPFSPKYEATVGARYTKPVGEAQRHLLALQLDYAWQDDIFFTHFNDPMLAQESYGLLDARVSLADGQGRWEVALFGRNLTDEVYYTNAADFSVYGVTRQINRPRLWGASWRVRL